MEYHEGSWIEGAVLDFRPVLIKAWHLGEGWHLAFEVKDKGDTMGVVYQTGLVAGNRKAKMITHLTQAGFYRVRTGQREYKLMPPKCGMGSGFPIEFLKELSKGFKFEAKRVKPSVPISQL